MRFKKTTSVRGFAGLKFADSMGHECSIQESSLATKRAIWLGLNDAHPKALHGDATRLGVNHNATSGWVDFPIPAEVSLSTRMHLTEKQVTALIEKLQAWVDEGTL